ncbi:Gfo/Idh/MocA family protein [Larkinella sp. GY13]|uniref:Gfo/Idh/MocA family protein n=1 Tax=Larkinella sp. GY13 TaxID=3453720 RepID=UPI003EEB5876
MKIIIIGGGLVSEMFHIPAALKLFGIENVIVAESSDTQRKKLVFLFPGIIVIEGINQRPKDINFAIIATPPHTHIELMRSLVENSIPFLCEKPIAFSASSVSQTIVRCSELRITAGVCHTYRFLPNRQEIKRLINNGFFGNAPEIEILEGDPTTWSSVTGYNFRREITSGGVMLDGGIHSLDFILWCLGLPANITYQDDSLDGLESNARLYLSFPSSAKAFFRISRTCYLPNTITVMGNSHKAQFGIFDFANFVLDGQIISVSERYPDEASNWNDIATVQLSDFIEAVRQNRDPRCSLTEAINSVQVIEECYRKKRSNPLPALLPLPGLTF